MITFEKQENGVLFIFENSDKYLYGDGTILVPFNSLAVIQDESDMITLRKSASWDIFLSGRYDTDFNYGSKEDAVDALKEALFDETGGGVTEEEVEQMIEEATSGIPSSQVIEQLRSDVNAVSGEVDTLQDDVASKADASALTAVNDALTAHTANTSIHVTSADKSAWDAKQDALTAGENITISGNVISAEAGNNIIELTQEEYDALTEKDPDVLYIITDASEINMNDYATKTEVDAALSGKADTTYVNQIATQATSAITELNTRIGTVETNLGGQIETLYANKFGYASYDSQTQRINFYNHSNSLDVLTYIDATAFIKDGMVSNVEIINGNLVITFNSDAGKQPISIPLTDIFNPANYYTTAQTQSYVSGFTYDKATIDQKVASGGTFDPDLYYDKTATDALLAAKADTATTYTKTEVDNALSSKADTSAVTAVQQSLSGKQDTLVLYTEETVEDYETGSYNKTGKIEATSENGNYVADVYATLEYDGDIGESIPFATMDANTGDGLGSSTMTSVYVDGASATLYAQEDTDDGEGNTGFTSANISVNTMEIDMNVNDGTDEMQVRIDTTGVTINGDAIATEPYVDAAVSGKADTSAVTAEISAATSGKVDTSAITTSITSGSTDSEIPTAKAVYDAIPTGGTSVTVDPTLDSGSTNPVANSAITTAIDNAKAYYISFATIATTGIRDEDWDGIVAAIDNHRPIYAGYPRTDGGILYYGVECMNKNSGNTQIVMTASDDNQHYFYTFVKNGSNDYSYTVDTRPYTTNQEKTEWSAKQDALSAGTGISISNNVISTSGVVMSQTVTQLVKLTQAAYDALVTKDANTLYIISD